MATVEAGFDYYVDDPLHHDLSAPCLDDLAEALAGRLGFEVEMVFPEEGRERIILYGPEDEEAEYAYTVGRRAR